MKRRTNKKRVEQSEKRDVNEETTTFYIVPLFMRLRQPNPDKM
jgi:hypothetical protein